ncbi:MAG: TIGR01212 family radical SAM protein [Oscillospiraceae bacterium]|nr:TIGR01212 family radical SAM protein [Oscillospiraceae bacterium]
MKLLSDYYKERFGCKIYKLSLDGGFSCPNRDGSLGTGGCIFCTGSGEFAEGGPEPVAVQLERAKRRVAAKNKGGRYMAYFQAFTNTYAPAETLRRLYLAAIEPEDIVGLAIGTRPDCLGDDVMAVLQEVSARKPVSVELGLQTIHEDTARYIRRGYSADVYFDAVKRLKEAGIEVVTHIILGLPGERVEDMVQTTKAAVAAGTDGVKFHLLHVLQNTDLAKDYEAGKFRCLSMEEYGAVLKQCIDVLPEHIVVHRITGDGAKKDLIAPLWSADKKRVLNYLHRVLDI